MFGHFHANWSEFGLCYVACRFRCSPGAVPKEFKALLKKLLQTTGPLMQSNFPAEWKKGNPDKPFDYRAWGFEKLGAAFESMPDLIVITKDGPKKSYVSLKGASLPAAALTNGAGGAMSSDTMKGVLAGAISSKVENVDPKQVEAFIGQPKLQFTIDCLVQEFAKFTAAGQLTEATLQRWMPFVGCLFDHLSYPTCCPF